jgi:hypothetical protein
LSPSDHHIRGGEGIGGWSGNDTSTTARLLRKAEEHGAVDQILASARCLRQIQNCSENCIQLEQRHLSILEVAVRVEATISDISAIPDNNTWTKLNDVHHGKRMIVYYKLGEERRIQSRIEFTIDWSLLVPLLAVLIETELYNTWVPRWEFPAVGAKFVRKLTQTGRTNQVLHIGLEVPWPFRGRELVLASVGVEDVEENGLIAIDVKTLSAEERQRRTGGLKIAPPTDPHDVEYVDFEGCCVFSNVPRGSSTTERVRSCSTRRCLQHQQ